MPYVYKRACPHCREAVRSDAAVCPHCTREIGMAKTKLSPWVWIVVGVVVIYGCMQLLI